MPSIVSCPKCQSEIEVADHVLVAASTLTVPPPSADTFPPNELAMLGQGLEATAKATAGRFLLRHEIAHGGMGRVYRAFDLSVGRDVAVKVLNDRFASRPDAIARFLAEARITGRLQHPAIPPVFEIGHLDDGRPFLAMKLIEGQTLSDRLAVGSADRGELLAIFEAIAQALAYAHDQGVIHRDLKPDNIMVGSFGEVQVMDWGLAKKLGEDDAKSSDAIRDPAALETRAGSILGTPGYMPPEQASGEIAAIDQRADVFGLGAILCVILTGRPPIVASSVEETIRLSAAGDLNDAYARLDASQADPKLVRLAKDCLKKRPEDRFANAGKVAEAVRAFRVEAEERARRAEVERVHAENERRTAELRQAEERKRRRVQSTLSWVLLAFVGVCAGAGWYVYDQWNQRSMRSDRFRLSTERILRQLPSLYERSLWKEARVSLEEAEQAAVTEDDSKIRNRIQETIAETRLLESLEETRLLKATFEGFGFTPTRAVEQYAFYLNYHPTFGTNVLDFFGPGWKTTAKRIAASPIKSHIVAALDDWAMIHPNPENAKRLMEITAEITGHAWRAKLIDALNEPKLVMAFLDEIPDEEMTPSLLGHVGERIQGRYGDGIRRIQRAIALHPQDFWLHMSLAFASKSTSAKVSAMRAALALRPNTFGVHIYMLSTLLADRENPIGSATEALEIAQRTVRQWPYEPLSHNYLGGAHGRLGNHAAAEAGYRKAVEMEKGRNAYLHWNGLGLVLRLAGKWEEAKKAFEAGLAVAPVGEPFLLHNLAEACMVLGETQNAIRGFEETIQKGYVQVSPYVGLAVTHRVLGNAADSDKYYTEAKRINAAEADQTLAYYVHALLTRDPNHAVARELAKLHSVPAPSPDAALEQRIAILKAHNRRAELRTLLREAFEKHPKNESVALELGSLLFGEQDFSGAVTAYTRLAELRPNLCAAHCNLGVSLLQTNRVNEAVKAYEKAVGVDPKDAGARFWLAVSYERAARLEDAKRTAEFAKTLDPRDRKIDELIHACSLAIGKNKAEMLRTRRSKMTPKEQLDAADTVSHFASNEHALAVEVFLQVEPSHPELFKPHRMAAAQAALRWGQGLDPHARPTPEEWHFLIGLAKRWLDAELVDAEAGVRSRESGKGWRDSLRDRKAWSGLSPIRDSAWKASLPPEYRAWCDQYWKQVEALLHEKE